MAVGFPTKANWAAGDVLTASAQDDLAGTVNLLSNASAASGSQLVSNVAGTSFAYQPTPGASNPVLNAAMAIAQRGTSFAGVGGVGNTLDRWQSYNDTPTTISRQATGDTTNLPFIQYCARNQRNNGSTSVSNVNFGQTFETINSIPFAGKTVTFSFYARKGANYSSASSTLGASVVTGTGTDQNGQTGFTGGVATINQTPTLTTTWQRFSYSATLPTTTTQIATNFQYTPTGTAGAADYFEVTGVQIDIGSVALPFRTYAATYQGELAACQRYFQIYAGASGAYNYFGNVYSTTSIYQIKQFPVTMRVAPTATLPATLTNLFLIAGTGNATPTAVTTDSTTVNSHSFYGNGMVGLVIGSTASMTAQSVSLNAEL